MLSPRKNRKLFRLVRSGQNSVILEMLRRHGKKILDETDSEGYGVAHWAALKGNLGVLIWMLDFGRGVDSPNPKDGHVRPLHWACIGGRLDTGARLLLERGGADPLATDDWGQSPFLLACKHGHAPLAAYLMHVWQVPLEHTDMFGDSALHWAAHHGDAEMIRLLIYWGMDYQRPDLFGEMPLHLAARKGHLNVVKELCEYYKVDVYTRDNAGRIPLQIARDNFQRPVISFLSFHMHPAKKRSGVLKYALLVILFGSARRSRGPYFFFLAAMFLWHYPIYFLYCLPLSLGDMSMAHGLFLFLNALLWILQSRIQYSDPGYVPENSQEYKRRMIIHPSALKAGEDTSLCHTCQIVRPLRSKHCRVCDRCVKVFNHHCSFLQNCVGQDNRASFFLFLLTLCTSSSITIYLSISSILLKDLPETILFAMWAVYAVLLVIVSVSLMILLLIQMTLNVTTNEILNLRCYSYMWNENGKFSNPFNQGFRHNVKQYFFPTFELASMEEPFIYL